MKKDIRQTIRAAAAAMTDKELTAASCAIMERLEHLSEWAVAKTIAAYWSLGDEVQTHRSVEKWSLEKIVLLPVVVGLDLEFRKFISVERLQKGCLGIAEPCGEPFNELDSIDMIIVPGVGFDKRCSRLGRGRGYYDRLLPAIEGHKVGVCFDYQLIDEIPTEPHDVGMDIIVTEKRIIRNANR